MRSHSRRFVISLTAALAVLLLIPVTIGLWKSQVTPWLQARLETTLGLKVRIGRLGLTGWRTLVAYDLEILGAPPFDSEPLAHADRVSVRLGGSGRGVWEPSHVTIDGLDVEYLSTGSADNLGRKAATKRTGPTAISPGAGKRGPTLLIRHARVRGVVVLPGGHRVAFRSPDVSMERNPQGQESTSLKNLVVDLESWATARLSELTVKSERGALMSAHGKTGALAIPGGGPLAQDVVVEALFAISGDSIAIRSGEGAPSGLQLSYSNTTDGADLRINMRDLPLRALGALTNRYGVGVEHARADGRLVASLDGESMNVSFQMEGRLSGVDIRHPSLDRSAWAGLGGEIRASGLFAQKTGRIELEKAEAHVLGARIEAQGWTEVLGKPKGEISIRTPAGAPIPCANLLAAQAAPVRKVLDGLALAGRLGFSLKSSFDATAWDALSLDVSIAPRCTVKSEPLVFSHLAPALLAGNLVAQAVNLPLGKYHPDFTSLAEMPKHLPMAFLTSEDSHFYSHNGFDVEMIRHALVQNLETQTFGRGASTITQQLAKNLFLTQHRTLARKLEETVLTWRLNNLLSKDRILELYLNVIDLGPGIRGVRQASRAYFGKGPAQLRPIESAYLATLAPNPHVLARRFRDGHVDDGWQQRLYDLLAMMNRSGRLSAADLAAARASRLSLRRMNRP